MAHWCETCGQQMPDDEMPADATWLGAPGDEPAHSVLPRSSRSRGSDKKLMLGIGAVIAAWGLFVLGARVVSPDDTADAEPPVSPYEAADAEPGVAGLRAEEVPESVSESLYVDEEFVEADADRGIRAGDLSGVGEPESDELAPGTAPVSLPAINTVQVDRIRRQLQRRDSNAVVVYRSADGVVVVDLRAGTSAITPLTTGASVAESGAHLLRSGADTFGINPDTLAVAQLVDDSSIVLTQSRNGATYYVDSAGLNEQFPNVDVALDGDVGAQIVPSGHQVVPLDGLGLVAVPKGPTGGTLIAEITEFVPLSEHRVLTGNQNAMLEQVCSSPISCSLQVTLFAEEAEVDSWIVPLDFVRLGDNYVLSPDGLSLLRYTAEGFAEVYGSADDSVSWVIGSGMEVPAWGPASNFIAWLHLAGDPKLKVMFPDERDWLTIDLGDLGAPAPVGAELIVLTPTASVIDGS